MVPQDDYIGRHIGGFEITSLIGRGGMGVVYKARDVSLERDVALKVMDPLLARDDTFMRRFRQEAKALARLQHPHIVTIYSLLESTFGVSIVMEYVPGRTLSDIVRSSGPLPPDRAIRFFAQLLSAFEHAHGAGIVHRDVKPGNILVTDTDQVKVTDFGLAKIYQQSSTTLTSLGGGTLFYCSPEQVEGLSRVDHRGDIYSLGMTLYEVLTGTVPFEDTESDFAIREKIVRGKIPPPKSLRPQIMRELNLVVMKAIARDPGDRYQSAAEMNRALSKIVPVSSGEVRRARKSNVPSSWMPYALAFAAIAVMGAVILVILRMGSVEESPALVPTPSDATVKVEGQGKDVPTVRRRPVESELPARRRSGVRLSVNPPEASIYIDGRRSGDGLQAVVAGQRRVRVVAGTASWEKVITVAEGETLDVPVDLSRQVSPPVVGMLRLLVNPKNAVVAIDGKLCRRGLQAVIPGERKVRVTLGRDVWEKTVSVRPGDTLDVSVDLTKHSPVVSALGKIRFSIKPQNATVFVDGKETGHGIQEIAAGQRRIRVVLDGALWEKQVIVVSGATLDVQADLTKVLRITVVAVSSDTPAQRLRGSILVDGVPLNKTTPQEIQLTFGLHTVALQHAGFRDTSVTRNFETDMISPDVLRFTMTREE
jgi:serine/threonine protein kinase